MFRMTVPPYFVNSPKYYSTQYSIIVWTEKWRRSFDQGVICGALFAI